jgi:hypothetical protein
LPSKFQAAILRFDYDDAWYPATDGDGRALLIKDMVAAPRDWRVATSWTAGLAGGTPGRGETGIAGDTNGDGRVDLVDLNNVRNNFGLSGVGIPGDTNGDNTVDLQDLNAVRNNFGIGASPEVRRSAAVDFVFGVATAGDSSINLKFKGAKRR